MMLLLAFVLPLIQLLTWAIEELTTTDLGTLEMVFGQYLLNTAGLSAGAASLVIAVALPIAYALRHAGSSNKERRLPVVARLATLGYAVLGLVIALGVLLLAAPLNETVLSMTGGAVLLSASLFSLMYGYLVRFLAIGFNSSAQEAEGHSLTVYGESRGGAGRGAVQLTQASLVAVSQEPRRRRVAGARPGVSSR